MIQRLVLVKTLLGILFLVFSPSWANDDHGEKSQLAHEASISIEQAIETAKGKVSGKVIEAELETEHDTTVWEVEIVTSKNELFEVHIDAASGKVIDVEEED